MRLIDKKGRIFGTINVIDFTVALFIVLAAVAALSYFSLSGKVNGEIKKVTYQIEMQKQTKSFADGIEIGDFIYEADKNVLIGTIAGKKVSPAVTVNPDLVQGKFVKAVVPDLYDVVLTVETDGVISDKSVSINSVDILTGSEFSVKGKNFISNAFILGIKF
jgi:hypothetical protein